MAAASPLSPEGFLAVDGQLLEYRWIAPAAPGGPSLVFLHEGLGCVSLWKEFPDAVARATGLGVLVYSRAGYGRSSPVPLPRPLTYMHDEALRVLPRVLAGAGLGDVVLLGHSDGGSIALVFAGAGTGRARVRGAILEAPHVFCEDLSVASIEEARRAYEDGDLRPRLARHHGDNVDVAFWGWNRAWLDPGFRRWNVEEHLPAIRAPLLVLQGREDPYGTAAQYEAIAAKAGAPVEVRVLERCGHAPHRDQPEATLAAVVAFVKRL